MRKSSRFATFARGVVLALPLLAAYASNASAAEHEDPRTFGVGSAFGGGVLGASFVGFGGSNSSTGVLPAIYLPTLELRYFLHPQDWSIDLTVPITNIAIISAASHAFYFQT